MTELLKNIASGCAKFGRILVQGGLAIAVFSIFWFIVAALGTKFGLWEFGFGLMTMTFSWGRNLVMTAAGLSILGILLCLFASPRTQPVILGLAGVLISGLIIGRLVGFGQEAMRLPPIHDIQTDWDAPIAFSEKLIKLRGEDSNKVVDAPVIAEYANGRWPGYGGRLVSEVQEEAEWQLPEDVISDYNICNNVADFAKFKEKHAQENAKDLRNAPYPYILDSKYFDKVRTDVFEVAMKLVKSRGWKIVTENRQTGIIEATDSTSWFGFEDDVAIRVIGAPSELFPVNENCENTMENGALKPTVGLVKVDVRSVSRVGLSDIGTNAKRVSKFLIDLDRDVRRYQVRTVLPLPPDDP